MGRRKAQEPQEPQDNEEKPVVDLTPPLVGESSESINGVPPAPPWLGAPAAKAYAALAVVLVDMGKAKLTDFHMLAMFCEEYATYVWAVHDMRVDGRVQTTQSGYQQVRPCVGIASTALQNMSRIGKELGLTIRSRSVVDLEQDVNKLTEEFKSWAKHE